MQPQIKEIPAKKFIGKKMRMSFSDNQTFALWSNFMPRRKEITAVVGPELYSIEVYPPGYFDDFDPAASFEKWAVVEVSGFNAIPEGMESLTSPRGQYAVFIHRGPASEGPKTYQYIFREWLPASDFLLANRPHFAVMGEKYKHEDPDSEEELWIPVKTKK